MEHLGRCLNVHYLQHVPFEGLGSIGPWLAAKGHRVTCSQLYAGEALPSLQSIDWLIVMGGPMNIYENEKYSWLAEERRFIRAAIENGKNVLGICLGAQLLADALGSRIWRNKNKEIGWFPIERTEEAPQSAIGRALPGRIEAFHWHGDTFELPGGATHLARSAGCDNQAFVYEERVVGLQFHLETTRSSAEQLINNCGNELVGGPYIQPADAMLADPQRFDQINRVMGRLLEELAQQTIE